MERDRDKYCVMETIEVKDAVLAPLEDYCRMVVTQIPSVGRLSFIHNSEAGKLIKYIKLLL